MRLHERHHALRFVRLLAVLFALALVAAACGDDDDDASADGTTTTEAGGETTEPAAGGEVEGDIFITGSSTVEPISVAVAEGFEAVEPGVNVDVEGPGTGDGMELFCSGDAEITGASRAIQEEEATACTDAGVEFLELKVANDGLTVMTSPANASVECLTTEDLYALTGPESEGFESWSDAQPLATELGSTTTFPDAPLDVFGPGEESGTYDAYIELALGDVAEVRVTAGAITEDEAATTRPDYQSSPDDNTIIQGVEGSDSSFGWVGFAFAQNAGEEVKEVQVDGGDGCVAPTADTITDNSYPLSRPLFIYVSSTALADNPAVQAFVDYYLSDEGIASVEDVGYVALPADELEASRTTLADGTTGTQAAS